MLRLQRIRPIALQQWIRTTPRTLATQPRAPKSRPGAPTIIFQNSQRFALHAMIPVSWTQLGVSIAFAPYYVYPVITEWVPFLLRSTAMCGLISLSTIIVLGARYWLRRYVMSLSIRVDGQLLVERVSLVGSTDVLVVPVEDFPQKGTVNPLSPEKKYIPVFEQWMTLVGKPQRSFPQTPPIEHTVQPGGFYPLVLRGEYPPLFVDLSGKKYDFPQVKKLLIGS